MTRYARRSTFLLALLALDCKPKDTSTQDTNPGPDDSQHSLDDTCPSVSVDPTSVSWVKLPYGEATDQVLTFQNTCSGGAALELTLTTDAPAFTVAPGLARIAPGESTTVTVTAQVGEPGPVTGTLHVASNDPVTPSLDVPLSATGWKDDDGDGFDVSSDCDDHNALIFPGADEVCNGLDDNCDGRTDDADPALERSSASPFFTDVDGDGYGDTAAMTLACVAPPGTVAVDGDCNDGDPAYNPGAAEGDCSDPNDYNCDGSVGFVDVDGDGYAACVECDDGNAAVHPTAVEVCNHLDDDCSGTVDGTDATDPTNWYADADGDHYGNPTVPRVGCDAPVGYVADNTDCDDADGTINPGTAETWYDGIDGDCDGASDYDQDGDGADAYTYGGLDCDDTDPTSASGSAEVPNGLDDDCDGEIDEGLYVGGEIIVYEVMSNPAAVSDAYGEWFEVLNTTSTDIDLYNWVVSSSDGQTFTITSSLVVPAGGQLVLGVDSDATKNGGAAVDYAYARADFALVDTDSIELSIGSTLVDSVTWTSAWPFDAGVSMGLDPAYAATGSSVDEWCRATSEFGLGDLGTPDAENDLCPQFDHDGDGYTGDEGDCDDDNAGVHPGAFEADDGLDTDCDGVVESAPTAVADYVSASPRTTCSPLQLDGSGSTDPEGTPLTFQWELTSAPATSSLTSADIVTAADESPLVYPDVAGTYVFTLVVSDGGADSIADSVSVTITARATNVAPVASAGADQTISGSDTCNPISYGAGGYDCDVCPRSTTTLSASASTDADGDELSYAWTVTSGATYGTLAGSITESPTLTITNAPATYGATTNTTVTVMVQVTDCLGATDTDTVNVVYACAGT